MTRKDLLNTLNKFEQQHPVDQWEIAGIKVWPLIKIDVFFRHIEAEGNDKSLKAIKKKKKLSRVYRIGVSVLSLFRYLFFLMSPKRHIPIFLSDSEGHRVTHKGRFIDRYFQPMKEHIGNTNSDCNGFLTISDDPNYERYPRSENIIFVHKLLYGVRIWNLFSLKKKTEKSRIDNFNTFLSVFKKLEFRHLNVNEDYQNYIKKRVESILANGIIIEKLIAKHQPKLIFELCYYSTIRFAINHLAHRYHINTVEIQHGGMGSEHISYSNWLKVPKGGYSLLPKIFWTWDEGSHDLINDWVKGQSFHRVIRGGNPWLSYASQEDSLFTFPKAEKIILYTLQYSEIPSNMLKVISSTPEGFTWWIRLHPRKLESKPFIQNELIKRGINMKMIEIDKATEYPLPQILSHSYLHISGSSGSIIEAAELGVLSLILDPAGLVYYQGIVKEGLALSMVDKREDELLSAVFNSTIEEKKSKMVYADSTYKRAIDGLIEEAVG